MVHMYLPENDRGCFGKSELRRERSRLSEDEIAEFNLGLKLNGNARIRILLRGCYLLFDEYLQ